MKTPNIPRFTAEASLSNTAEHYQLFGVLTHYASRGRIAPQSFCYWEQDAFGTWYEVCDFPK